MSIGARRHRITLMSERMMRGAGGRLVRERPIIADVWAQASLSGAVGVTDSGTALSEKVSVAVPYHAAYVQARFLAWEGNTFRIESYRFEGTTTRRISFDASRVRS